MDIILLIFFIQSNRAAHCSMKACAFLDCSVTVFCSGNHGVEGVAMLSEVRIES